MKTPVAMLLFLLVSESVTGSEPQWFLPRDCVGPDFSLEVSFDDSAVLKVYGPACIAYKDNVNRQWSKEKLTVNFEPNREVTWAGYRDEPFNSPADSVLTVDLWLAGADADQSQWIIGVSVRGDDTIYTNTTHLADLNAKSESCIALRFCIRTQPIKRLLMAVSGLSICRFASVLNDRS